MVKNYRLVVVLMALAITSGCAANESVIKPGTQASPGPTAEPRVDSFENDLADVKRADFTWLFVIRRRDGGILKAEDKAMIRVSTGDANRRIVSDGDKAVIVGSNYEATVASIENLKKQFEITDLSTGKAETSPEPPPITSN